MTWKEFKEAVDKHLADNDLSDDIDIDYIDISSTVIDHMDIWADESGLSIF